MSLRRLLQSGSKYLLVILIAGVMLWLALRDIDWSAFMEVLGTVDMHFFWIAGIVLSITFMLRGLRWWLLLRSHAEISVVSAFWGVSVSYLGNSFLPARAGELMRASLIGRQGHSSFMYLFATVLVERIIDALLLIVLFILLLPIFPELVFLQDNQSMFIGIGTVLLLFLLLVPLLKEHILNILQRLPLPTRWKEIALEQTQLFLIGLQALQSWVQFFLFLLLSALIIGLEAFAMQQVAFALGMSGGWYILFLLAALGLSSALPSTPGALGIYQFVAVAVLTPLGYSQEVALAYILMLQATTYSIILLWGIPGLILLLRRNGQSIMTSQN